jgi:hypothetical protein
VLLDTADVRFGGPGSSWPHALRGWSAVVLRVPREAG